jgi:hypothetical protein
MKKETEFHDALQDIACLPWQRICKPLAQNRSRHKGGFVDG